MNEDDTLTAIGAALLIIRNEDFRDSLYFDTGNKPHIGYGFRLDQPGALPTDVAAVWLATTLRRLLDTLTKTIPSWNSLALGARAVIIDMAYNMGHEGLMSFTKMIAAINDLDYDRAAHEILESKYARQSPERASRNAHILRLLARAPNQKAPCPDVGPLED